MKKIVLLSGGLESFWLWVGSYIDIKAFKPCELTNGILHKSAIYLSYSTLWLMTLPK